ncbi:MAG: SUF system NifU family Fe-S cluster assembly protein [Chromatiales bacterium]|jgi:nitrogen fixation NifU-like protein|nr:SUF system NifU family Fe-S cluster assembly protein [Chromatiales bacterium]
MSDGLQDLYQEVIFDHNRNPRHAGRLEGANRSAQGFNPLCGDKVTLYLHLDDAGVIRDIRFEGSGCAISVASTSLMTDALIGKTVQEAQALFARFHDMMMGADVDEENLGKLQALSGVKEFPSRIKCATLGWHALHAALKEGGQVSTE